MIYGFGALSYPCRLYTYLVLKDFEGFYNLTILIEMISL